MQGKRKDLDYPQLAAPQKDAEMQVPGHVSGRRVRVKRSADGTVQYVRVRRSQKLTTREEERQFQGAFAVSLGILAQLVCDEV